MGSKWNRFRDRMVAALDKYLDDDVLILPPGGEVVWRAFADVHAGRQMGMSPSPIMLSEIEAWIRMNRVPLRGEHIDVIRALDRAWLERANEDPNAPPKPMTRGEFEELKAQYG